MVRASDFGPRGPWFESRPVNISLWLSKSHLPCLVLVEPRKRWTDWLNPGRGGRTTDLDRL